MRKARTSTLKRITGSDFRLSQRDRAFLADLARVRLVSEADADVFHYEGQKTGSRRRLDKLCSAGLLKEHVLTVPGQGTIRAYSFSSDKVAKRFGGAMPSVSRMRNAYHELIVSRIFFAEGRPESFKVENDFTQTDREVFRRPGEGRDRITLPDAMYYDAHGQAVVVEADSGQYNSTQIREKVNAWQGHRQVWGQPQSRKSAVENLSDAKVHRF